MYQYFIVYKPFNVLSQFSSQEGKATLKDHFKVPSSVYPVGRLDFDSEGLLILTDDASLNKRLLDPRFRHEREYWVQVDGAIDRQAIERLSSGVIINVDGKPYTTRKCKAAVIGSETSPIIPERYPPIRYRAKIPTTWISLTLTEGKNRQVRKMTAQTGFPTLRLIRYRIERLDIRGWMPGNIQAMRKDEIYALLFGGG